MMKRGRNLAVWTAISAVLVAASGVRAQVVDEAKAAKVKAAYLYQFTKFVEWPEESFENDKDPVVIGILGDDRFGSVLDKTVRGKRVKGRKIVIRRFPSWAYRDAKALGRCHILFVDSSMRAQLEKLLPALAESNVLLVGDGKSFAQAGGMIGLVLEEGRIVFHVNREAVKRAGLKISAKLLNLARIVKNVQKGG